ncbi:DUF2189 domain-containing protein [Hyphomonas sp.]|uniref:DUF2189 domain-containing protein n=1 Tax=Hyphomonas sp. TaxID=87 RepID=UPI00391A0166
MNEPVTRLPDINDIPLSAPLTWLASGWRDFWSAPVTCSLYGILLSGISAGIFLVLYTTGSASWFFVLLGGFLIAGPLLGMGLYHAARELSDGRKPSLSGMLWVRAAMRRDQLLLGLLIVFLYFLWTRIAQVIYALSTPQIFREPQAFLTFMLTDPAGQTMALSGILTGGVVAFCNFSLTAISAPMLLDRRFDVFMAMATSVRAVNRNFYPMFLWAVLITGLTALGVLTAFLGLIIVFPVIGLASWHAYVALVRQQGA